LFGLIRAYPRRFGLGLARALLAARKRASERESTRKAQPAAKAPRIFAGVSLLRLRGRGRGEWPDAPVARLNHVRQDPQSDHAEPSEGEFPSRGIKQCGPAQYRQHGWPRIEPHLKGKPLRRPAS